MKQSNWSIFLSLFLYGNCDPILSDGSFLIFNTLVHLFASKLFAVYFPLRKLFFQPKRWICIYFPQCFYSSITCYCFISCSACWNGYIASYCLSSWFVFFFRQFSSLFFSASFIFVINFCFFYITIVPVSLIIQHNDWTKTYWRAENSKKKKLCYKNVL